MRYPEALLDKVEKVKEIHSSWKSSIHFEDVIKWILQFDSEDYDLAIRIIEHLNFLNFGDVKNALTIAYSKLIRKSIEKGAKISHRNTLFAGMGESGKSGSMISYHFRIINELSEENFNDNDDLVELGEIENIVLIDDIISTGYQATKEIIKLTEKVTPSGVKNIFLLTVCGMKDAIRKIEEETKAYTFSAIEYSTKDTAIDLDGRFYQGLTYEARERLKARIEYYGKVAYTKQPFGFGQIGGLIAFDFNTPNTTLPLIWSDSNSWIPLFKRSRRINGINSYFKQFDRSKKEKESFKQNELHDKQTDKQDKDSDRLNDGVELSIYVEGKVEEALFDILVDQKDLAEKLGYKKINVVALGGAVISRKLIVQLSNSNEDKIFIFENDRSVRVGIEKGMYKDIKFVLMSPNIMQFFKIHELIRDEQKGIPNAWKAQGLVITTQMYFDLEIILIKNYSGSQRSNILQEYVLKYFNEEAYEKFLREVKRELRRAEQKSNETTILE